MKISIKKINQAESFSFDEQVDLSEIELLKNDIRKIGFVTVKGEASSQGETITCRLNIKGTMILPCARTLVDVPYPFEVDAVELFSTNPYYTEEDESEIHPIDGEVLDLTPFIKENVLLEIPFRVFADDEQIEANALTSGEGWEVISKEKKEGKIDPRLEKLRALLNDEEKNENQ